MKEKGKRMFQESVMESELSKRIRFLMWRDNLRQKEAAAKCKLTNSMISQMLTGNGATPTIGTVERIARAFNVPATWLLGAGDITYALNNTNKKEL